MALALDTSSRGNNSVAHTILTWSHTCSGLSRVIYVLTSVESDTALHVAQTVSGITYGDVALVKVISKYITGNLDNGVEVWRLIAPATGANNVVVTYTGEVDGSFGAAVSFTGADQTNPDDVSGSSETTPAGASVSKAVTTLSTNAILLNIVHALSSTATLTKDADQTQLYNEATTGDFTTAVGYRVVTTAASYTTTWSVSPNDELSLCVVAVKEEKIAFGVASNSGYQATASTYNWLHTCTGSNRYLVVGVSLLSVAGSNVTGITYNAVASYM